MNWYVLTFQVKKYVFYEAHKQRLIKKKWRIYERLRNSNGLFLRPSRE